jgi:D-threo-aldose 1-dehydrogenase
MALPGSADWRLARPAAALQKAFMPQPFALRPLGRTGLAATSLGFGAGPLGNLRRAISDATASATLDAAWQAGIRYFDTAPLYGHGLSEQRLGRYLRGKERSSYVVASKVGRLLQAPTRADYDRHGFVDIPPLEVVFDYSRDGVRRSLEASLERLGLERIDIALVHDPDRWTHGDAQPARLRQVLDAALPALVDLKAAGTIAAVGVGLNEWQPALEIARQLPIDVVLLAGRWTLLDREAGAAFLPFCAAAGIAVVVGGPFNSGILATGAIDGAWYNYAPAPPAILERTRVLERACAGFGVPLAAAALQFPLRDPAVAAVIPGLMSPAEAEAAAAWMQTEIPEALWRALDA